jgi:hypothetical protein
LSNGNSFRKYTQRLRNFGFVSTGNDPPYFPPITGDYQKDFSTGEVRYIPGIISFAKPIKNPLVQVDLCKFSNGDFMVRAIDIRKGQEKHLRIMFDNNGNSQDKEKVRELEALLFGEKGVH